MEENGHGMAFKSLRDIKEHITLLGAELCRKLIQKQQGYEIQRKRCNI